MSRSALVLSTVGLTAAALVTSTVVATSATAKPVGRSSVHLRAGKHHMLAPNVVRPGIAHLRTDGYTAALVVEAKHGTGSAKQAAAGLRSSQPNKLLDHYRFVAFVLPGQGVYTRLTRGTYYVASGDNKPTASSLTRMTVTGSRVDARLPKSRTVVEDSHKSLHTPYSMPRRGWLHVLNRSSAFSNMFVFGVASKATYRTLQDLVAHPTFKKLGEVVSDGGGFTFVDADSHSSTWTHFAGRPGRYVAAVIPVRSNGSQAGLHRGQVRVVHVK